MEDIEQMNIDPATAAAMVLTSAKTMTDLWLASNSSAAEHLKSGWHVSVEVITTTTPVLLRLNLVDPSDGARYPKVVLQLPHGDGAA